MIQILLTRHAQSLWNAQGRWQGQADIELSELGTRQAAAAGRFLAKPGSGLGLDFDAVATSPLQRARNTGEAIAERLGLSAPYLSENINERSVGEWSGLTRPEIEEQYPGYLGQNRFPPSWEDDGSFSKRILDGLVEICNHFSDAKTIIAVAHGGLIYNLEARLGIPFNRINNLGARLVHFDPETRDYELGARVDLLADFDEGSTTTDIVL